MGANVEADFDAAPIFHTFALLKDKNGYEKDIYSKLCQYRPKHWR